ncbi:ipp-5 [Pristionchus pacificus]|uniref:inositol-polyphosphate 5-phosphatase n=1 Tax=Pristionchus pacificus TaxID=54126 RepID=A0A2A6CU51_PRIPA|nr:ipp-5 [Pristionchus pacificus]|eukprot:PDM81630.1 ipp-5 [Pristionchus pacificus]
MNGDSSRRQRLLLMTANVGSLFEEGQRLQEPWLDVISKRILSEDADLSVIHMQETGGKRYVECSGQVPVLIEKLADRISGTYPLCRAFLDLNYTSPAYTALGSIFFVHKHALSLVEQFDFARKQFVPLPTANSVEIRADGLDNESLAVKRKFPKHFWPAIKWGRKGYLHTRWIVDGKVLDLINVHLFHDESNLALIHENPSLYSSNRKRALDFVINECVLDNDDDSSIHRFIFGDLNFRLDSKTFLNRLTEEAEPHPMEDLTTHGSQDLLKDGIAFRNDINQTENLRRTVSAIEFRREDGESNENCVLRIGRKVFDYENPYKLQTMWETYLQDDKEVDNFPELYEMPITFPPTYPWSEDPLDSGVFMKTRAPAWCDRVLMNKTAYESMEVETSVYESIGRHTCMGDHKPVALAISLL